MFGSGEMNSSAPEVGMRQGFKFFGPVAGKPGFASAPALTIRQLRASGVGAKVLLELGAGGEDLSALLSEYNDQLRVGKLADISDVCRIASEQDSGRLQDKRSREK
jgi:hypothetical protein